MRLSATQIHAIKTEAHAVLGEGAQVSLFGSRVDDTRRGGDIDLYITGTSLSMDAQLDAKLDLLIKLKQALGEQRIDIVYVSSSRAGTLAYSTYGGAKCVAALG